VALVYTDTGSALKLLVNRALVESALEGGYTEESASPEKQKGTRAMFTLTCNPAFRILRCMKFH
jgi:hypothetical protein